MGVAAGYLPGRAEPVLLQHRPGLGGALPALHVALLGFERLIDIEEVLYLHQPVLLQVADVVYAIKARVGDGHAQQLFVNALLIPHQQHADRPDFNMAAGESRLLNDD